MSFVCSICEKHPNSHSLIKYEENEEYNVYYTCPSNATNNDTNGILYHFDGVLGENNNKKWIWILDVKGFTMKQFLEIENTICIIKLINEKYSTTLQKIVVINSNSTASIMYKLVKPFLNKRMKSFIVFQDSETISEEHVKG
jgi:hypothetical protein